MRVLGIDTCGPEGSIALADVTAHGVNVLREQKLAGRTCSEELIPAVRKVLESEGTSVAKLHAMVVVRGPGSFTGVRAGLSTVKGLAQAANIPVIGVSRLQVMAQTSGAGAAVLDAGRGEMYFGQAGNEAGEVVLSATEIQNRIETSKIACCEVKTAQLLPGARMVDAPTASDALRFALGRILGREYDDIAAMDAHYLRRSEAEVVAERRAAETAR